METSPGGEISLEIRKPKKLLLGKWNPFPDSCILRLVAESESPDEISPEEQREIEARGKLKKIVSFSDVVMVTTYELGDEEKEERREKRRKRKERQKMKKEKRRAKARRNERRR